jgi:hypothetical protein
MGSVEEPPADLDLAPVSKRSEEAGSLSVFDL